MKSERLGNIAELIAGQSPPSSSYNGDGVGVPFFQGKADYGKKFPSVRYWCSEPTKISLPEDILISMRAPVGPVNINNVESCIGRGLSAIRVKKSANRDYIFYWLKANEKRIADKGTGSTFKAITQKTLSELEIPFPSLTDQIQIANILSKAETLIEQRKQSIALLDEFLKSTFLEMFGDPTLNTKNWNSKRLDEISMRITDGKHGDCKDDENSGYYFLSAKDLNEGKLKYTDVRQITKEDFLEVHKRTDLKLNDILLGNTGASIGKIGIVIDERKAAQTTFQKSISIVTVKTNLVSPLYLKAYLGLNRKIFNKTSTGSAMTNLLLSQIRAFDIQLPSIELQTKFASIVTKTETLKEQYKNSLQELENLYGSLSQQAFKGELEFSKQQKAEAMNR